MKISTKTLYLALSRLLRLLLVIFALLYIPNMVAFGVVGGLTTTLLIFMFVGLATIIVWTTLEILMPRLSAAAFYYCAAVIGAIVMLVYWLLQVRRSADLFFLPLFMIVSGTFSALLAVYLRTHQQKYASLSVYVPPTRRKLLFAGATLFVMLITISGYLVSDYSNTAIIRVQKGETARLRYFRPTSHYLPRVEIDFDILKSDDFAESSGWDFFDKNPVTLHLRSDSGCEQILRSEGGRSFAEITPSVICQPDAGFHQLDVEIIDAASATIGKPLHIRLTSAISLKEVSYRPYYLFAQLYFAVPGLWIWLALWGVQLSMQHSAARSPKSSSATV